MSTSRDPDQALAAAEAALIARSVTDPALFGKVFDRHFPRVRAYCARHVGACDADGLAGDVFLVAFERRHTFDPARGSAAAWLVGIAANLARRHHRSASRRDGALRRLAGEGPPPPGLVDVDDRLAAEAAWPGLAAALARLRRSEREALLLVVWEGLTYDEAAAVLGVPPGTARSRAFRARQRLRDALGPPPDPPAVPVGPVLNPAAGRLA